MKKKIIGYVGVDSGQVVVCDPCYIDSQWEREDRYKGDRKYLVRWDGEEITVDMEEMLNNGINYEAPLKQFGNMTMNELVEEGHAHRLPVVQTGVFGYNGCCMASNSEDQGGQLVYRMGHAGVAVCVSSGYGDGYYPVTAYYDDKNGRVRKIEVKFF